MIESLEAFSATLAGTPLAALEVAEAQVLDTGERIFALRIQPSEMEACWRIARALVDRTGRWPVATTFWTGPEASLGQMLAQEDPFSRFLYEESPERVDFSPRSLRTLADAVDPAEFVEAIAARRNHPWSDTWSYEIDNTKAHAGSAPSEDDLRQAISSGRSISTAHDLDRWLLEWEERHGVNVDLANARLPWFDGASCLMFLPTARGWDALAYLHWYGTSTFGAHKFVALGRSWQHRYGAELVAHFGTMVECFVTRPPTSLDEAWKLAREHDLATPCTLALPGISLRDYARALIGHDRWFLHERP